MSSWYKISQHRLYSSGKVYSTCDIPGVRAKWRQCLWAEQVCGRRKNRKRRWAKICMPGSGHKLLLWDIWEAIGRFYFDLLSYSIMWMKHRCKEGSGRPDRERCSSSGMKGSWWDPRWSSEVEATLNWWMRLSSEQEWRSYVLLDTHISIVVQVWPWVSWWERVQEEQTERNPQGS